jgi:enamine deaminase RidA (YjgF/YER057c/UK114 family)
LLQASANYADITLLYTILNEHTVCGEAGKGLGAADRYGGGGDSLGISRILAAKTGALMSIRRKGRGPFGHHCLYIVRKDTVFLAGIVADDLTANTHDQTVAILEKIDSYLAEAGTDKSKLLTSQVWLRDMADYEQMNAAWDAWVDQENMPVRATVEARLARDGYRVEIMVTAAIG